MQSKKNIDLSERKGVHQFLQNKNVSRIVEIRLPLCKETAYRKNSANQGDELDVLPIIIDMSGQNSVKGE